MHKLIFCGLFSFGVAGCLPRDATAPPEQGKRPSSSPDDDPRQFEARLLEIAQSYQIFPQVDPTLRVTRTACAAPSSRAEAASDPEHGGRSSSSVVRASARSSNPERAGQSLYFVFIEHPAEAVHPIGQAVVKEVWACTEVADEGADLKGATRKFKVPTARGDEELEQTFQPYARDNGRLYHAREKAALLIMFKTDPHSPGTDHGWVYGSATADGRQVTSVGKVESCMKCHKKAPHDRVFGLVDR